MSVDTTERIITKAQNDLSAYYIVDLTINEDLIEQASAPFIAIDVEPFTDFTIDDSEDSAEEEGVAIFKIFSEKGTGTNELHEIRDAIKTAFRQVQVKPTGQQEGTLVFGDLTQRAVFEQQTRRGEIPFLELDVMIDYKKIY